MIIYDDFGEVIRDEPEANEWLCDPAKYWGEPETTHAVHCDIPAQTHHDELIESAMRDYRCEKGTGYWRSVHWAKMWGMS